MYLRETLLNRRLYQPQKQRVRLVGTALELGMKLNAGEKTAIRQFYRFDKSAVRRQAADGHPFTRQCLAVVIVEFKAVAVPFAYFIRAVQVVQKRALRDFTGIRAQPHGAA